MSYLCQHGTWCRVLNASQNNGAKVHKLSSPDNMATSTSRIKAKTSVPPRKVPVSVDKLADQLASGLTLNHGKGKQKATAPALSTEEMRIASMRSVNAASQGLSTIVQSSWKRSAPVPPKKSNTLSEANALANSAATHLETLRKICPEDLDVERAAASVIGKLVALEMVCSLLS